jgi:hypothetical protein
LVRVFGRNSVYFANFDAIQWGARGSFIVSGYENVRPMMQFQHQRAYIEQLGIAEGVLRAARADLARAGPTAVYDATNTPEQSSDLIRVQNLARFALRKAMRQLPTNEREVQDAFETLLVGADIAYTREKDQFEYSTKGYKPDFVFEQLDLALEVKFCGRAGREVELVAEINDDILAYRTRYSNIVFTVYDCGLIREADRFAKNFQENQNVVVFVIKH